LGNHKICCKKQCKGGGLTAPPRKGFDMDNWQRLSGDCIEWADGSIDAVYSNEAGDVEWKPATTMQIAAYKRHKEWVAQGCPDIVIKMNNLFGGLK